MQKRLGKHASSFERADARGVGYSKQTSYEAAEAAERDALREKVGKRRPGAKPKKQTGGAMDAGLMGGSLRALSGLTKNKGRGYTA